MSIWDIELTAIDGSALDVSALSGKATLVVNVASRCGLTPQYEALQRLHEHYGDHGFSVVGVPCNQFGRQEPGTADEIAEFCTQSYGVTFPLTEKVDVNGRHRHPLFEELTAMPDDSGLAGDVHWNFEKFLVSPHGNVVARFRPTVLPESDEVVAAIEANLPSAEHSPWKQKVASEVRVGDRVRVPSGLQLTVSRIVAPFLGNDGLVCLVEDTQTRWLAQPVRTDAEVEVLQD